ncbi:MAG: hypothetical protein Kow002_00110 [Anaerolineales bacterium]
MKHPRPILMLLFVISLLLSACGQQGLFAAPTPGPPLSSPKPLVSQNISYPFPGGELRFDHIGLEDGLSQSTVHAILQDRLGFIWFGTEDGLNRYDGNEFKIFRPDPYLEDSLSDRWITSIIEDQQGYLWIGTRLGGLNRYDSRSGKFRTYRHEPNNPNSISSNRVNTILEDTQGFLWIGTDNGLNRFNPKTNTFTHFYNIPGVETSLSNNHISVLFEDSKGMLWIGTSDGGLNRLDADTFTFTRFMYEVKNPSSLSSNAINDIAEDQRGNLWVATPTGLNRMSPFTNYFVRYTHDDNDPNSLIDNSVFTLLVDKSGILWIGTDNGLDRHEPQNRRFVHYQHNPGNAESLRSNIILSLYEDRGGVLWVGMFGGGVDKYNRGQNKFAYYQHKPDDPNSLSSNLVGPIAVERSGIVWIGTYGGGLNRFDPRLNLFTHFKNDLDLPGSLLSDFITSLFVDSNGMLWVGSNRGLSRWEPDTELFTHFTSTAQDPYQSEPFVSQDITSGSVMAIYEDAENNLWVGTTNGLNKYDPETGTFTHFLSNPRQENRLSSNSISCVFQDSDGNLWVGTSDNGLNRIDPESGRITHYLYNPQKTGSLSHSSVTSVFEDSRGILWVATAGGGLNRYHPARDNFTYYTVKHGLPNNVVYGLVEDSASNLWISTNYGLSRFNPVSGPFRNYTVEDGLQSNEFSRGSFARGADGRLIFGGVNGLNIFDPANIQDNMYAPPVVFTAFEQNGVPLPNMPQTEYIQDITLAWPNNSFTFEFTALSYAKPASIQYAYKLENFDTDWNYIGTQREGRYTNLPGGTYVLYIKATNADNIWSENSQSVRITVVPPFWNTWAFRALAVLLVMGVSALFYRIRVRNIESLNYQLERLVQERTSALQKRTSEIEALYAGDEKIIRALSLDQIYKAIVDVAIENLNADRAIVFTWNEAYTHVSPRVSHGFSESSLSVMRFEKDEGLVGRVLSTGKSVIVDNVRFGELRPDVRAAIEAEGIHSFVHVPIIVEDQIVGIFNAGFMHSHAITADTVRLFTALVQRAALSIENMQLFEQTKEVAVIEERNRVARDLHDSAKQKAFAALAQLGTVNGIFTRNPESAKFHLKEAENLVYEVIQELTFLIQEMYPMALKEKGLATTLREYIFEWENRNGVMVDLAIRNPRRMKLETEQALYRMIQEALANIARHSQADDVDVSLTFHEKTVQLIIADNGVGFDVNHKANGIGLRSIRERAESIGGTLQIESQPGRGTKLTITTPFNGITK